ncbi:MAG: hypothetical protein AABY22_05665 [Nanoarchaeota archaeon]
MRKLSLKKIQSLPTIHQGHFDNLKIETQSERIWLSRMTIEDGMPYNNQVTEEKLLLQSKKDINGKNIITILNSAKTWQIVRQYEAL